MSLLNHKTSEGKILLFEDHTEEPNGFQNEYIKGEILEADNEDIILDMYNYCWYPRGRVQHKCLKISIAMLVDFIKIAGEVVEKPMQDTFTNPPPKMKPKLFNKEKSNHSSQPSEIVEFKIIKISYGDKGTGTDLKIKLGNGESIKINLNPGNWVRNKYTGKLWPKFGSNAFIFFKSLQDLEIKVNVNLDTDFISTSPTLIGKVCEFEGEEKSYQGKPYKIWRVKSVKPGNSVKSASNNLFNFK
ncbi:MAG: hypothetical protein ACYDEF_08575 [Methanosarcina sp.]